jgi:hypothetical protein
MQIEKSPGVWDDARLVPGNPEAKRRAEAKVDRNEHAFTYENLRE